MNIFRGIHYPFLCDAWFELQHLRPRGSGAELQIYRVVIPANGEKGADINIIYISFEYMLMKCKKCII